MNLCPCQSGKAFAECCGPIIDGSRPAPTAEALMRSRYSAYATGAINHITDSLHPDHRDDYDPASVEQWANNSDWLKLEIVNTNAGGEKDDYGTVEFIATYREKNVTYNHHELAEFSRLDGKWYFTDGKLVSPGTVRNTGPKVGRNDPCPCGSGKKYKKCCGQ